MDGASISARRRAIRLSQQRLAEMAGCSIAMISLLERGYSPDESAVRERVLEILEQQEAAA